MKSWMVIMEIIFWIPMHILYKLKKKHRFIDITDAITLLFQSHNSLFYAGQSSMMFEPKMQFISQSKWNYFHKILP